MSRPLIIALCLCLPAFTAALYSQTTGKGEAAMAETPATDRTNDVDDDTDDDGDSRDLREGEVIIEDAEANPADSVAGEPAVYPFLNLDANHINLNGDDWTELGRRYRDSDNDIFTFVHIGDSHLQADIATGQLRAMFQNEHGNGGRGLLVPYRLAGTNEPVDYRFTFDCKATSAKMIKQPWDMPMGFTGVAVSPLKKDFVLNVENRKYFDNPFRFIRVYGPDPLDIKSVTDDSGTETGFTLDRDDEEGYTDIFLDRPLSSAHLSVSSDSRPTIFGLMLSAERNGVFYHVVGNNGATYTTYNRLGGIGRGISTLYPDLIIVSLGTNEAFGKLSEQELYGEIDRLVDDLRRQNPEAKLLLTTPKECQRRVRTGRKRRRAIYSVVENCRVARQVILDYCGSRSIPVYDWYAVSGGEGASGRWVDSSLLSSDRVHNTREGYMLFGTLFHDALVSALSLSPDNSL